ncbi:NAD+ synthase [Thermogladius sp. KZ2Tp1]|uniref:NAD+ synthase n=1 Tax=Thermogladius sp. KZ2Tp1 TaxID=3136289 RepID=UPI003DA8F411
MVARETPTISVEDLLEFPLEKTVAEISNGIREFLDETGRRMMVIGVSGGLDSAVALTLLAKSAPRDRILALIMPDTRVNKPGDTVDAVELAGSLGVSYRVIPIDSVVDSYLILPGISGRERIPIGNLRARIRMSILYLYANALNGVVVGTSDRSELLIGYFTKYGDGASDFLPQASLYKTQLRRLARYLGLPEKIVSKPSSPALWENHYAEEELGMKYEDIDRVLYALFDMRMGVEEAANATGLPVSVVERVLSLHRSTRHKRQGFRYVRLSWVVDPLPEI